MPDHDVVAALVQLGVPADEAARAVETDRVAFALVDQILERDRTYTAEELATAANLPLEMVRAWERALGVPSPERYSEQDLEDARLLGRLFEAFPTAVDDALRSLRADAQALARMAVADLQFVHERFVAPIREAGGNDIAVALAAAEAAKTLLPISSPLVGAAYRRILEHLITTELVSAAARAGAEQIDLAVGFVDVVGYTALSARIDPDGLDEVLESFESRCYAVAGTTDRVQLVKFLGDAAMFISLDPVALATTLLALVGPEDDSSPLGDNAVRGGMAAGEVLARGGDYFGNPVNLAARLTDRARPGTILVAEELEDELNDLFHVRRPRPMHLRGLGVRRPVALKPPKLLS